MAEVDTSKLKGDSSCHVLSDKGRENYDRIFRKRRVEYPPPKDFKDPEQGDCVSCPDMKWYEGCDDCGRYLSASSDSEEHY